MGVRGSTISNPREHKVPTTPPYLSMASRDVIGLTVFNCVCLFARSIASVIGFDWAQCVPFVCSGSVDRSLPVCLFVKSLSDRSMFCPMRKTRPTKPLVTGVYRGSTSNTQTSVKNPILASQVCSIYFIHSSIHHKRSKWIYVISTNPSNE